MKPKIEDLLNQLPKEVSVEQHYHDEQQKLIHNEEMKFTFGDKLEALDWHKEEHGLEYVTITGINQKTKVYYWEADLKWELGGKLSSGYYFHEAIAYKPKQDEENN